METLITTTENIFTRYLFDKKKVKCILLSIVFIFGAVFFTTPILAQIENIYDAQSDQVAGINALMSAVANNDVNGARFFSKAGRALVNQKNLGGATALHLACRENNFEIIKILVESGADVNAVDNEGWTPLMRAALAGNKDSINLLLDKGAQGNYINSIGESAIIHAALSNCTDCLDVMFEKFNFAKLMDIQLLKEQLTNAFIIARNHENEVLQGILESYLDRVIKIAPLIKAEKSLETKPPVPELQDKVFKFIPNDPVITDSSETTIIEAEENAFSIQKKEEKIKESSLPILDSSKKTVETITATAVTTKPIEPKINASSATTISPISPPSIVKFRFISGPQGEEVKPNMSAIPSISTSTTAAVNPQKTIYKLNNNCSCNDDNKAATIKKKYTIKHN